MRRAPVIAAATAAGLAGVLISHTSAPSLIGAAPTTSSVPSGGTGGPNGTQAPPATQAPTETQPPGGGVKSAVGAAEQYGYGVMSVRVTVRGRKITDVTVANLQVAESYSQSLAQQVIPMLRSEVLSAQSAQINAVSGATYTSEAYAYSVQSALDRLHA